jgi:hypothetical protein
MQQGCIWPWGCTADVSLHTFLLLLLLLLLLGM